MKKVICASVASLALLLTSCGSIGAIYTDVTGPGAATANKVGKKVGVSESVGVLGLVAIGNAGINAAAKEAGITKISHVDVKTMSVLGIFSKNTTYVYGE